MKNHLKFVFILIFLLQPVVRAQLNGRRLLEYCEQKETRLHCIGYVGATADTLSWLTTSESSPLWTFPEGVKIFHLVMEDMCVPGTVTYGQLRDAVIEYLHEHPHMLSAMAPEVVYAAMKESWVCSSPQKKEK